MEENRKLNNKGYMLIEIILASTIAFGLAYYMLDLTLKLKNKNDDLLVETMVMTDNSIISNAIMNHLYNNNNVSDCDDISITKDDSKVMLNGEYITTVSEYITVGDIQCDDSTNNGTIHITVPITINKIADTNSTDTASEDNKHNIDLYYKVTGLNVTRKSKNEVK